MALVPADSVADYRRKIIAAAPPDRIARIVEVTANKAEEGEDPRWGMLFLKWMQQAIGTPTQTILTADATPAQAVYDRAMAQAQAHVDRLKQRADEDA